MYLVSATAPSDSGDHADQRDLPTLADEHPADVLRLRAERHANADLSALRLSRDTRGRRRAPPRRGRAPAPPRCSTISIVNDRLAMALAARRSMVKTRYIGDVGHDLFDDRAHLRGQLIRPARPDDVGRRSGHGRQIHHRVGGPLRRKSSTRTSSTTPMMREPLRLPVAGRTCLLMGILAWKQHIGGCLADDHVAASPCSSSTRSK